MRTFGKIIDYLKGSAVELKKVVWPTRKQAINLLIVVIVFSLVMSFFLGGIDFLITKLIQFLLQGKTA